MLGAAGCVHERAAKQRWRAAERQSRGTKPPSREGKGGTLQR